ncbi:aldehyde dehydrogenase [Lepidopterella palustris CBS 459.81]|uniref:aldehyde dehydrogenase (NAD(+)) n=1 Tax=Lepidopterella palustris CBS 459.81 TaxID=1314670 RepID=A0A8E2E0J1_9PEZI|nr:aldehyde dehydrogenase [Lepidopterella palustris CBS 459.81]
MAFKYPLPTKQFIHGEYVDSRGTERLVLRSSRDDTVVSDEIQLANAADVDAAVESALKGFKAWNALAPERRRGILLKFADLIEQNGEKLSYLETVLVGKAVGFSIAFEVSSAVETFRYFAGYVDKFEGDLHPPHGGFMRVVNHEPLGVCASVIPFNSPIITFAMKAAPALTMGNVLITKASELNPFSTLAFGELANEAGFPPGVINILIGAAEAGAALASHMKIRKISFTGSALTGKKIQVAAAQSNLKRVTLELGGKSPVVVFDDADVDNAVANSMSFVSLNGQGCVLGTRIYVQRGIADEFVQKLKGGVEGFAQTLGADPFEPTTMSSPLFHHRQKETVMAFLEQGKKDAELITGGDSWGTKGCFVQPTIFYKPKPGADIVTKEIFGPVVVVDTFDDEEEVVQKANDTEYGLGAYVYTSNMDRAFRVSLALEAGSVSVNSAMPVHPTIPFGGWKGSGIGRENAKYVLRDYSQPKSIIFKYVA